jgi:Tol biopolymer transport system component
MNRWAAVLFAGALWSSACGTAPPPTVATPADPLRDPREAHLRNIRQLTFGGENAEGYWSPDGRRIIFQSTRDGLACDQIFTMNADGTDVRRVSTGAGKCTCSYFFPGGERILYSSTHLGSPACPPRPDYSKGYVWRLEPDFDIFTAAADGSGLTRLTDEPGYDAEATLSPDGSRIVFTSVRDGDLDLYTMNADGTDVRRLTTELGYDGGAFYSRDGKRLVWRASRPKTDEEKAAYAELLATHAIRPMALELFVGNADGSDPRQITGNAAANFGPYFFPDGRRIIFASNLGTPGSREFDLWMIRDDGTGLEQVTFTAEFDGFPMFSPDGKHLLFASNRNAKVRGETNLFVADWVETSP